MPVELSTTCEVPITFGDLDPMGIVWHGNYVKFMERGREHFGRAHELDAMRIYAMGWSTPIVRSVLEHKAMLEYGDIVEITTLFVPSPAAKVVLRYRIQAKGKGIVAAIGETTQVFLDRERRLQLVAPDFFLEWKQRHGAH
ncbi:MAG: acyl-CoA thioesterase [Flavobacteriales bacterium]|nr:acyl-CoA thioesterase [Flavobacteriales bacterium]